MLRLHDMLRKKRTGWGDPPTDGDFPKVNYICTNYAVGEIPLLMIPDGIEYYPDGSSRKRWLPEEMAKTILGIKNGDILLSAYVPEDGSTAMVKLTLTTGKMLDRLIAGGHDNASRMADRYGQDVDMSRLICERISEGSYTSAVQRGRIVSFCRDTIAKRMEYWTPEGDQVDLSVGGRGFRENMKYVTAQNYIEFSRFAINR